jgi:prophage tail gpP-like protein
VNEFNMGDKVTVRRGKHRGPATICSAPDAEGQYAVTTAAGHLLVTNRDNLKAPEEVTFGTSTLAAAFAAVAAQESDNQHVFNALDRLARRIGGPDLANAIDWPMRDEQPTQS